MDEVTARITNDLQREINLLNDRVIKLERFMINKIGPKKNCGECNATGKVYHGTMFDPPLGNCNVCDGKGYV